MDISKIKRGIVRLFRSNQIKDFEKRVLHSLKQATELYESNKLDVGIRWFNIALRSYNQLPDRNKELTELIQSLGSAYSNPVNRLFLKQSN
jgi:hypothetical protein